MTYRRILALFPPCFFLLFKQNGAELVNCYLQTISKNEKVSAELTQDEFQDIRRSYTLLKKGLAFEQRFDIVLENYSDIERIALEMALQNAVFPNTSRDRIMEVSHTFNRYLINFLSSSRIFNDQTYRDLKAFEEVIDSSRETYKAICSSRYDSSLAYRFMEELRNYLLHNQFPVDGARFNSSTEEIKAPSAKVRLSVEFFISISKLKNDPKFKMSVIAELERLADQHGQIAAFPLLREYVDSLILIYQSASKDIFYILDEYEKMFDKQIARLPGVQIADEAYVFAFGSCRDGKTERLTLNGDYRQQRSHYLKKHLRIGGMSRRIVSST